jgi:hypothetical protein
VLAKCGGCLSCGGGGGRRDVEKGYGGRSYAPTQYAPAGAPPPGYYAAPPRGKHGQFIAR